MGGGGEGRAGGGDALTLGGWFSSVKLSGPYPIEMPGGGGDGGGGAAIAGERDGGVRGVPVGGRGEAIGLGDGGTTWGGPSWVPCSGLVRDGGVGGAPSDLGELGWGGVVPAGGGEGSSRGGKTSV